MPTKRLPYVEPKLGFTGVERTYEDGYRALERVYRVGKPRGPQKRCPVWMMWDVFKGHVFCMNCTSIRLAELWIYNTRRIEAEKARAAAAKAGSPR